MLTHVKHKLFRNIILSFGMLIGASAVAQPVQVQEPWVRATVKGQQATGAFMKLTASSPLRLVQAQSPIAGLVEIHEMKMDKDVMRMSAIAGLDLTPGRPVDLKPGGYHVMLMQLKQEIKEGDSVPITLIFEHKDGKKESLAINAPTRALGQAMKHKH
ncbi:MAG: copper chaperone PCu(A)C [Burkholderiales bacterium]|jgi:copper(I)-binding protein